MAVPSIAKLRKPFGFFKRTFFPIYKEEYPKFFFILSMFVMIPFNYALARGGKDGLVYLSGGGEISNMISTLKVFIVLPMMWFFKRIYSMLSRNTNSRRRLSIMITYFGLVFGFFTLYYFYVSYKVLPIIEQINALTRRGEMESSSLSSLREQEQAWRHLFYLDLTSWMESAAWVKNSAEEMANFSGSFFDKICSLAWYQQIVVAMFTTLTPILRAIEYWPVSIYYVHAEAWGSFILSVGFWGMVNSINTAEQSKRFYIPFMVGAGLATAIAGGLTYRTIPFYQCVAILTTCSAALLIVYNIFENQMERYPAHYLPEGVRVVKKKKRISLTLRESFAYVKKHGYIRHIASIVLCYGLLIAAIEILYRGLFSELKHYYIQLPYTIEGGRNIVGSVENALKEGVSALSNHAYVFAKVEDFSYHKFLGIQLMGIGVLQALFALFGTRLATQKSWRFMALPTPVIAILGTIPFMLTYWFGHHVDDAFWGWAVRKLDWTFRLPEGVQFFYKELDSYIPLQEHEVMQNVYWRVACAYLGVLGAILIKSVKYVAFDTSKEQLFVVAESYVKTEGKAAIDGLASRLGKAVISIFNALIFKILVENILSQGDYHPYKVRYLFFFMMVAILALWLYSVFQLAPMYEERLVVKRKISNELSQGTATIVPLSSVVQ